MRKLGLAVALAAAALFAQGARAEDAGQKTKDTAHEAGGAAQKTGKRWEQAGDRAVNGKGSAGSSERQKAEEARSPMNGDAHNRTAQNTNEKKSMFDGKKNFDLDGKIANVSGDTVTISRDDLPPVELKVSHETKIELDGDRASSQQLKQGQDVKASFNLNKDKVEAVEIKAKRTDAQKDAHKDAEKRRDDMNRNDMNGPAKK
jgi:hypothetical protein